jgi:acyl carrier protein
MESVLMLEADLEQRVIRFVARKTGLQVDAVTPSSRLLHDLRIDGDDAEELLTEYSEAFEV